MKKIIKLLLTIILIFLMCSCTKDSMENITIYTSMYPVEFVTNKLYQDYSTIYSIYPSDVDPYNYKLTDKQINNYSKSDLIVYNGLGKENDIVVQMLNKNKKLKIIDATAKIEYNSSIDEIWINPSNVITIAQNVRNGLKEYITSAYLQDIIDDNYEKLKLELSTIDAQIKETIENSTDKDIIVASDDLKILSKYGLNIISVDENSITDKTLSDAKNLLDNGDIKFIYVKKGYKETETMKNLKEEYNIEYKEIDTLNNLSQEDKNNNKDYITIMNENIDNLKEELY